NGINGTNGTNGINGTNGTNGVDGVGIKSVDKTKTEGLVDTYTITLTNGQTFNFTVTNGKDGAPSGGAVQDENASTPDSYFRFIYDEETESYAIMARYQDMPSRVVIPSSYNGKPVTGILDNAFGGRNTIDEVVIPRTIVEIGYRAFADCRWLSSVIFEEGIELTEIGASVFSWCTALRSVVIPASVTRIGSGAFYFCYQLELEVPDTVTDIASDAFVNCASVTLPFIVSEEQIAQMRSSISNYLKNWLMIHAQETITNQSYNLKTDLMAQSLFNFYTRGVACVPSWSVTFKSATYTYTVVASWNSGSIKLTFEEDARTIVYDGWAGEHTKTTDYIEIDADDAASDNLNAIIEAMAYSVNEVTSQSVTGRFSVEGTLALQVYDIKYSLNVRANIDRKNASNTQIAARLMSASGKELLGVFYDGSEMAEENRLTVKVGDGAPKYINYANVLSLLNLILPPTAENPGKGIFESEYEGDEGNYYENDVHGLSDLLGWYGIQNGDLMEGVLDFLAHGYESEDGERVLVDINLGEAMAYIADLIADFGIDLDQIPFLNEMGLDIRTMHGLLGHISLAGSLNGDRLSGLEFSVNIPESCFYFSADETGKKFEFSRGFALSLSLQDFTFSADNTLSNVIPERVKEEAEYFNPTDIDIQGDVTVSLPQDQSTYRFRFVSEVNLFELLQNKTNSKAKFVLNIQKSPGTYFDPYYACNFLTVTYEQEGKILCVSGTMLGLDDGSQWYTLEFFDRDTVKNEILRWLGLDNWQGLEWDEERGILICYNDGETIAKESAKIVFSYALVPNLVRYYYALKEAESASAAVGSFSIADILSGVGSFFKVIESDNIWIDGNQADIHLSNDELKSLLKVFDSLFQINLTDLARNGDCIDFVLNTEDYNDGLLLSLRFRSITYALEAHWVNDRSLNVEFRLTWENGRQKAYSFTLDRGDISLSMEKKASSGEVEESYQIDILSIHFAQDKELSDVIDSFIPSLEQKEAAMPLLSPDGTGAGTELARAVLLFLNRDTVYPIASTIGRLFISLIV
ncbi:MAG TPA: hypothetical protein DIC18_01780, partial [Clostridiales bacterium]|nr:hypothetical protein [Clostridiales bacterium]